MIEGAGASCICSVAPGETEPRPWHVHDHCPTHGPHRDAPKRWCPLCAGPMVDAAYPYGPPNPTCLPCEGTF